MNSQSWSYPSPAPPTITSLEGVGEAVQRNAKPGQHGAVYFVTINNAEAGYRKQPL